MSVSRKILNLTLGDLEEFPGLLPGRHSFHLPDPDTEKKQGLEIIDCNSLWLVWFYNVANQVIFRRIKIILYCDLYINIEIVFRSLRLTFTER